MPILGTLPRIQQPITDISATTVINWLGGPIFSRSLSSNLSFTFTNEKVGQEIYIVLENTSSSVVTASFAPSSLVLRWEKGEVLNQVGATQSTVFKFTNFGMYILASVVSERVRTDIGGYKHVNDFFMLDPSDIGYSLSRWVLKSGTGRMTYETSADNGMGYGRFAFDGNCLYEYADYLPVMPYTGVGGFGRYKKSLGTANIYLGVTCYDANKNDLTTSKAFIANGASVTTTWALSQGRAKTEGAAIDNLVIGTRFVRPYIQITNYTNTTTDKVYLSGYNIFTSNFSTVADYA